MKQFISKNQQSQDQNQLNQTCSYKQMILQINMKIPLKKLKRICQQNQIININENKLSYFVLEQLKQIVIDKINYNQYGQKGEQQNKQQQNSNSNDINSNINNINNINNNNNNDQDKQLEQRQQKYNQRMLFSEQNNKKLQQIQLLMQRAITNSIKKHKQLQLYQQLQSIYKQLLQYKQKLIQIKQNINNNINDINSNHNVKMKDDEYENKDLNKNYKHKKIISKMAVYHKKTNINYNNSNKNNKTNNNLWMNKYKIIIKSIKQLKNNQISIESQLSQMNNNKYQCYQDKFISLNYQLEQLIIEILNKPNNTQKSINNNLQNNTNSNSKQKQQQQQIQEQDQKLYDFIQQNQDYLILNTRQGLFKQNNQQKNLLQSLQNRYRPQPQEQMVNLLQGLQ